MIDRDEREALARALRDFAMRQATNDALAEITMSGRDLGTINIWRTAWYFHDFTGSHRIGALTCAEHRLFARMILFLRCDLAYRWPDAEYFAAEYRPAGLLDLLTLGRARRRRRLVAQRYREAGELSCWPFFSRTELCGALRGRRLRHDRP